ncbi:MAG: acyl-CoA thioesterase [Bacteroidota bacterium]
MLISKELSVEQELAIRFSDTDAMGVVWHGNYVRFFEDGREAFGEKFGLKYLDIYASGFFTPIVSLDVKYKSPIYYGDRVTLRTRFQNQRAAKMTFHYEIISIESGITCATATSVQVFVDAQHRRLELTNPQFYASWKTAVGL